MLNSNRIYSKVWSESYPAKSLQRWTRKQSAASPIQVKSWKYQESHECDYFWEAVCSILEIKDDTETFCSSVLQAVCKEQVGIIYLSRFQKRIEQFGGTEHLQLHPLYKAHEWAVGTNPTEISARFSIDFCRLGLDANGYQLRWSFLYR